MRPGYDVTAFFGRSGLYDAQREGEDGIVPMARPAQGDHHGPAFVASILAALDKPKTQTGQIVETSLYETAVWTQASDYAVTALTKRSSGSVTESTCWLLAPTVFLVETESG